MSRSGGQDFGTDSFQLSRLHFWEVLEALDLDLYSVDQYRLQIKAEFFKHMIEVSGIEVEKSCLSYNLKKITS